MEILKKNGGIMEIVEFFLNIYKLQKSLSHGDLQAVRRIVYGRVNII